MVVQERRYQITDGNPDLHEPLARRMGQVGNRFAVPILASDPELANLDPANTGLYILGVAPINGRPRDDLFGQLESRPADSSETYDALDLHILRALERGHLGDPRAPRSRGDFSENELAAAWRRLGLSRSSRASQLIRSTFRNFNASRSISGRRCRPGPHFGCRSESHTMRGRGSGPFSFVDGFERAREEPHGN